jgi:hypothetical protein
MVHTAHARYMCVIKALPSASVREDDNKTGIPWPCIEALTGVLRGGIADRVFSARRINTCMDVEAWGWTIGLFPQETSLRIFHYNSIVSDEKNPGVTQIHTDAPRTQVTQSGDVGHLRYLQRYTLRSSQGGWTERGNVYSAILCPSGDVGVSP